ncbi:glycosyltransferase family 90 protein, partial [Cercospora zeae-maydis SCOH1-5]
GTTHPIKDLMHAADKHFEALLGKWTVGLNTAAAAYRTSRGRHPPPGWDKYISWCEKNKVYMVEDFFDPMYRDLAPFWSVSPEKMRTFPQQWHRTLSIRNGSVLQRQIGPWNFANWTGLWQAAIEALPMEDLPDVDLAVNMDDEPKVFARYEILHEAKAKAEEERRKDFETPLEEIFSEYEQLEDFNEELRNASTENVLFEWSNRPATEPIWDVIRDICPPDTPGSHATTASAYNTSAEEYWSQLSDGKHMEQGFVRDWAASKSACLNPALREVHGSYVGLKAYSIEEPVGHENTRHMIEELVPLLSGCKISDVNADILLPPAIEFESSTDNYIYDPHLAKPWSEKDATIIWRGMASGGDHTADNWTRFHRHRLVAMLNGTLVAEHFRHRETGGKVSEQVPGGTPPLPHNFPLPLLSGGTYRLAVTSSPEAASAIETWLGTLTLKVGSGFNHMQCFGENHFLTQSCWYMDPWYSVLESIPSSDQFQHKFLPDVDGHSYSGRFLGFLQSNSLPIKATVYDQWHDGRLVPWKHFVPMDNGFEDLYGILEYFAGYDAEKIEAEIDGKETGRSVAGHDENAEEIATAGAKWSRKVLRREDRLAYLYRLILELARLGDERRGRMGWVEDLR